MRPHRRFSVCATLPSEDFAALSPIRTGATRHRMRKYEESIEFLGLVRDHLLSNFMIFLF